jgi:hypothetical protein
MTTSSVRNVRDIRRRISPEQQDVRNLPDLQCAELVEGLRSHRPVLRGGHEGLGPESSPLHQALDGDDRADTRFQVFRLLCSSKLWCHAHDVVGPDGDDGAALN